MHRAPIALLLALAALTAGVAGCLDDGPADTNAVATNRDGAGGDDPATTGPNSAPAANRPAAASQHDGGDNTWTIAGAVMDERGSPLAGATVTIRPADVTVQADERGAFEVPGVPRATTLVTATLAGYRNDTVTLSPSDRDTATAILILAVDAAAQAPYTTAQEFAGQLSCAAEYVIISGPCDALTRFANDAAEESAGRVLPEPIEATDTFDLRLDANWQTTMITLTFAGDEHPGLDGLRLSASGRDAQANVGVYDRYATMHGPDSFTLRLDAGGEYDTGVVAVPHNATDVRLQVLPHSHGYKSVCDPEGTTCFLGVGAAHEVAFEVQVTTFYGEPAPAGWTPGPAA